MATTQDETVTQIVKAFQSLDVDEQLALFWFIYKQMGDSITPAAPQASTVSPDIAEGLYNQIKEKSHEEQLQFQRDLINNADTEYTRMYGSMSDTTKLLVWYRLAQGMDSGTIIPMPPNYELSSEAKKVLEQMKGLEFEQQITTMRDYVSPMGAEPKAGAEV
ncbi:orange carotenoid protein N-terminal domain-containing protein [Gloeocapsopsis dulcis]|uniref:Orange carotenoid protein n=1 Tax=Gloeocapsopsis dulcis AAB1 = 1H9 TaxID=1433147 RepID=A0A6N8FVI8_9CHRO|nr:orange carotenoid protein N-terminal domain-containing protein [Gloeocapsopsis dulcis]MUL36784.1 Orange carotenoid protein [Gloeocapsopsis dulcis AAB1 = 1H9]WNN88609.1 orange carotenoid protein N-terminal domain-containing protein [Gloeocapsopsis dulcis]